jgi:hypothetical protein
MCKEHTFAYFLEGSVLRRGYGRKGGIDGNGAYCSEWLGYE